MFENAAALFHELGVRAFVRHGHMGSEGLWWPSPAHPRAAWDPFVQKTGRNVIQEMIDRAHALGQHIIVYYWTYASRFFSSQHPAWIQRQPNGTAIVDERGTYLCVNSPWRQEVIRQLTAVAKMGPDGFYYDHYAESPTGCYCQYCQAKFQAKFGRAMPTTQDPADPAYHDVLRFNTESLQEHWAEVLGNVTAANPQVAHLLSVYKVPCANNGNTVFETTRLLQINSNVVAKTEYTLPDRGSCQTPDFATDTALPFGWALARDAASARSPHVWMPRIMTADQARASAAAQLTWGAVANPDHTEARIPDFALFNSTYRQAALLDPYLNNTVPLPYAALLHSEQARDLLLPAHAPDAATQLINPAYAAFEAFLHARMPVTLLTDTLLDTGGLVQHPSGLAVPLVVIVNRTLLTPAHKAALANYTGKVLYLDSLAADPQSWTPPHTRQPLQAALLARVRALVGPPPVEVSSGSAPPGTAQATVAITSPASDRPRRLLVMVANNVTWCETPTGKKPSVPPKPAPISGLTLTVRGLSSQPTGAFDVLSNTTIHFQPVPGEPHSFSAALPNLDVLLAIHIPCATQDCFVHE